MIYRIGWTALRGIVFTAIYVGSLWFMNQMGWVNFSSLTRPSLYFVVLYFLSFGLSDWLKRREASGRQSRRVDLDIN